MDFKWEALQDYAQDKLVLPKVDNKTELQRVADDLLFQEILKLNVVCKGSQDAEDLLLIPSEYRKLG